MKVQLIQRIGQKLNYIQYLSKVGWMDDSWIDNQFGTHESMHQRVDELKSLDDAASFNRGAIDLVIETIDTQFAMYFHQFISRFIGRVTRPLRFNGGGVITTMHPVERDSVKPPITFNP